MRSKVCVRTSCPPTYTLFKGTCMKCPSDQTFVKGKCIKKGCKSSSQIFKGGKCYQIECREGFEYKSGECVRTSCPPGFELDKKTNECSKIKCSVMGQRFSYKFKKCVFKECPPNFRDYKGYCVQNCGKGEDTVDGKCIKTNCDKDFKLITDKNGKTACQRYVCEDGNKLEEGKCLKVSCGNPKYFKYDAKLNKCLRFNCPKEYTLKKGGWCKKRFCESGYTKYKGACRKCPEDMTFDVKLGRCKLTACPKEYTLDVKKEQCFKQGCEEGFQFKNGRCQRRFCEDPNEKLEGFFCVKYKCKEGEKLKGKKCIREECPKGY